MLKYICINNFYKKFLLRFFYFHYILFIFIYFYYHIFLEQIGTNHNGTEADDAMDIEAGQFEDAEEDL